MLALRYLTLAWPGLPWLWLRGSMAGLVLALATAVSLNVAVVTTFIWGDLVELPFTIAVWTATGVVWLVSTVSAVATFPPPLARPPSAEVDPLYVAARDAYLARDWTRAESRLRELLAFSPTDGEAQLLLGTLLRRVGRLDEARGALEKLAASDAGSRWRQATAAELVRIAAAVRGEAPADDGDRLPQADQASSLSVPPATRAAA
jgi:tetratricopeptide (TPR) repeat protein